MTLSHTHAHTDGPTCNTHMYVQAAELVTHMCMYMRKGDMLLHFYCMYIHTYKHTHTHTHTRTYAHTYTHTYKHTHTHTRTRTYTHTHMENKTFISYLMIHVTEMTVSSHTDAWVMSHIWIRHFTEIKKSCHRSEWVVPHRWEGHVTEMNVRAWSVSMVITSVQKCFFTQINEWVMSQKWMHHVTEIDIFDHKSKLVMSQNECINRILEHGHPLCEWVMSQEWMYHVTEMDETCRMSHGTEMNVSSHGNGWVMLDESCQRNECAMWQRWMGHVGWDTSDRDWRTSLILEHGHDFYSLLRSRFFSLVYICLQQQHNCVCTCVSVWTAWFQVGVGGTNTGKRGKERRKEKASERAGRTKGGWEEGGQGGWEERKRAIEFSRADFGVSGMHAVDGSCHTYERITPQMGLSHVTHINELCDTYACTGHVTHVNASGQQYNQRPLWHSERVMSQIRISQVTHIDKSRHAYECERTPESSRAPLAFKIMSSFFIAFGSPALKYVP